MQRRLLLLLSALLASCGPTGDSRAVAPAAQPATPTLQASRPSATVTRPMVLRVHSANAGSTYIDVTFSKPMMEIGEGGGVTMHGNYNLDQQALPRTATIICASPTCELVRIGLPTIFPLGSAHTLQIANVVDRNGMSIAPDPAVLTFQVES